MTSKRRWLIGFLMVLLVSCVTVNIYFPAAAIQKAADQIVDDVRKAPGGTPEQQPGQAPDKKSGLDWLRFVAIGASEAHAAAVDVNVSTPAIRALKDAMAARFPQLQPLYGKGAVGETNNGLVAVRDTGALSLKEKADVFEGVFGMQVVLRTSQSMKGSLLRRWLLSSRRAMVFERLSFMYSSFPR